MFYFVKHRLSENAIFYFVEGHQFRLVAQDVQGHTFWIPGGHDWMKRAIEKCQGPIK